MTPHDAPRQPERQPASDNTGNADHSSPATDAIRRAFRADGVTITLSLRTIAVVLGIWLAFWIVRTLTSTLLIFAVAILIAVVVDRPVASLERRGVPRGLGIVLMFLVMLGVLAVLVAVLIPLVTDEITTLEANLGDYRTQLTEALARYHVRLPVTNTDALFQRLSDNLTQVADRAAEVSLGLGRTAIAIFATFVMAFMLAGSPTIGTRFAARFMAEEQHRRVTRVTMDIQQRIAGWARGQVLVAVTFGLLFGLSMQLIGLPYAATLGLTAGVLEIVPYLASAITLALALGVALTIGPATIIGVVVAYTVLVNIESHILAPKLVGGAVGLPPVVVLGALLVGLELEGIVGVLLAVPMALIISAILDEFWPPRDEPPPEAEAVPGLVSRVMTALRPRHDQ